MRGRLFLLVCYLLLANEAAAQFTDSLKIAAGIVTTAATAHYQPLWLVANRNGTVSNQQRDASAYLLVRNTHRFARKQPADTGTYRGRFAGFYVGYGATLRNNNHLHSTFLEEGYGRAGFRTWQLRAGRYHEVTSEIDPTLASGSFGISGNALPVPKVELAVTDYTPVPFTHGWVQFRGQFAHGWLGNGGEIKDVFLHQKSFYLRVGQRRLTFYGGLTHFVQWGGTFPSGPAPGRFKDYLRIIRGASGDATDPVYLQGPVDIANAVGNHILVPDFGVIFRKKDALLRLYTQTIFDKGIGDSSNTNKRDWLDGLKILGRDRLVGLSWETAHKRLVQKILLEGIYTKYQGGPIIYNGRDNYYNNGTYAMGWFYQSRIIGTPLFIAGNDAARYGLLPSAALGIWSNRLIGLHLGIKGTLTSNLTYRLLATHAQHYGNYYNDAQFPSAKKQTNLLVELPYRFGQWSVAVAVAADFGDVTNNLGGLCRIGWQLQ